MNLTLEHAPWCHVHGVYDLRTRKICRPGRQGTYGLENENGDPRYYLTIGRNSDGVHMIEKGHDFGLVYPARLFVWGKDEHGVDSPHATLLAAVNELKLGTEGFWCRCELFHGYAKGRPLFRPTLVAHTDIGPRWYQVDAALKTLPPAWEVISLSGQYLELWKETDEQENKTP